ncbi:MAG: peptidylprolyl isomerase [Christiangramia sp.]|nr:peptidylprolyl isomerase [Christiangramia sp.]
MAVLNKIRQRSVFLIIIIALALFSFVLADVIRNGGLSSGNSQNVIATVNGKDIDRQEFAQQVENFERNMGGNMSTTQAVNRIWDERLRQVIIEEQIEELGIRAGEGQVTNLVRTQMANNPNFLNEAGMFDENRLREYVANLKASSPQAYEQWVQFTDNLRETAKINNYYTMVGAGIGATEKEGELAYQFQNNNVNLKYVQIPYDKIPHSEAQVSKSEISDYIKSHPEEFKKEASRSIQYVVFDETASNDDKTESQDALKKLRGERVEYNAAISANDTLPGFDNADDYEDFVNNNSDLPFEGRYKFRNDLKGEYSDTLFNLNEGDVYGPYEENGYWKMSKMLESKEIPDSVKASHILVAYQGTRLGAGLSRTKSEAKELADSIARVVKADTAKFAQLAVEFSADQTAQQNNGDLGYFTPGAMIPEFEQYAFGAKTGDVGVVETPLGYHVVAVKDQTTPAKAVKIATIAREITPSEKTMNNLFNEVTKFEIAAAEGDFSEVAKEGGYEVKMVQDMKAMDENIPGAGAQRRIVQWAFGEDAKTGDVRRFDTNNGYVVAQLTEKSDEGLMSAEDASSIVTPILQNKKKAEIIKSQIKGQSLDQIAQNQGVSVQSADAINLAQPTLTGAGSEPRVVGTAFGLKEGETSQPIAGNKGVYVVQVVSKFEAPKMDSYKPFAQQQSLATRAQATMGVFEALKEKAEIEDNRSRFY